MFFMKDNLVLCNLLKCCKAQRHQCTKASNNKIQIQFIFNLNSFTLCLCAFVPRCLSLKVYSNRLIKQSIVLILILPLLFFRKTLQAK